MPAGWRLLPRAAIQPSRAAQVRSRCADGLSWQKVKKSLLDTCGARAAQDKIHVKRIERMLNGTPASDAHYANNSEWEGGLSYENSHLEDEEREGYEEERDEHDAGEEAKVAEEIPAEVEKTPQVCDNACVDFIESE